MGLKWGSKAFGLSHEFRPNGKKTKEKEERNQRDSGFYGLCEIIDKTKGHV